MRSIVGGLREKSDNYLLTGFVHRYISTTMRPSSCKSTVTVTRSVAGITMEELAAVLGCNRNSLQQIELGRLKLSEKMAERIALHTGVDMGWLLSHRYEVPPVCRRDPKQPYTREAGLGSKLGRVCRLNPERQTRNENGIRGRAFLGSIRSPRRGTMRTEIRTDPRRQVSCKRGRVGWLNRKRQGGCALCSAAEVRKMAR
jgi:transcriptional regulator with XRE-family HTH domain